LTRSTALSTVAGRRYLGLREIMAAVFAIAIAAVLLAIGLLAALGPKLLLNWHLREVSRMKIAERPDEAIVTYPLA
jgi:hypothetical protein